MSRLVIKLLSGWQLIPLLLLSGCDYGLFPIYSSKPVHGTVVNAVTGEPLKNVIVMGNWPDSHVQEVVSDENGRFEIPAWHKFPDFFKNRMYDEHDVSINFYKQGYLPKSTHNSILYREIAAKGYRSEYVWQWNGKVVELQPFDAIWLEVFHEGVRKRYENTSFYNELGLAPIVHKCLWKSVPNMLIEIGRYLQDLKAIEYELSFSKPYKKKPLLEYIEERFSFDPDKCHPDARRELQAFIDAKS